MEELLKLNKSLKRVNTLNVNLKNLRIPGKKTQVLVNTGPIVVSGLVINRCFIYREEYPTITLCGRFGEEDKLGIIAISPHLELETKDEADVFKIVASWRGHSVYWSFVPARDRDIYYKKLKRIQELLFPKEGK